MTQPSSFVREREETWRLQRQKMVVLKILWVASSICMKCKNHKVCSKEINEVLRFLRTYKTFKACEDFIEAFPIRALERPLRRLIE